MILASASSGGSSGFASEVSAAVLDSSSAASRLRRKLHHPAARVFPGGGELNCVALLQHFERGVPELQVQDFAFLREQVEIDTQAVEGAQMAVHDRGGDHLAGFRRVAMALFNFFQSLVAKLRGAICLPRATASRGCRDPSRGSQIWARRPALLFRRAIFFSRWRKPRTTSATCTPVLSM
jgi:hypothetical protein